MGQRSGGRAASKHGHAAHKLWVSANTRSYPCLLKAARRLSSILACGGVECLLRPLGRFEKDASASKNAGLANLIDGADLHELRLGVRNEDSESQKPGASLCDNRLLSRRIPSNSRTINRRTSCLYNSKQQQARCLRHSDSVRYA